MFRVTLNYKRKLKGNLGYRLVSIIIITIIIKFKLKGSLSKWAKSTKTNNNARSDVVLMPVIPALGLMKCIIIGGGGGLCHSMCGEVRRKHRGVSSILPPLCGFWEIKLGSPGFYGSICCPTLLAYNLSTWESSSQNQKLSTDKGVEVILWYLFKASVHTPSQSASTWEL